MALLKGNMRNLIEKVKSGQIFGLLSVLLNQGPKEKAVSLGFSSIYSITREEFISILKDNKEDYVA